MHTLYVCLERSVYHHRPTAVLEQLTHRAARGVRGVTALHPWHPMVLCAVWPSNPSFFEQVETALASFAPQNRKQKTRFLK